MVVDNELIHDLDRRELFSIKNLSALNNKVIKDSMKQEVFLITTDKIKIGILI